MPVALDYAPPSSRRRKWIRRVAVGALVIALAAETWRWGPGVYQQASILVAQWKCMHHEAPADQVIYASGPNPKMLPADKVKTEGMPSLWYCGGPRKEISWDFEMTAADVAPVFSHQVRNNGQTRLIYVLYCDYAKVGQKSYRALSCHVVRPATWTTPQKDLWEQFTLIGDLPSKSIKVFAGQSDSADASHFTINVLLGDVPWVLDCWLQADDSVKFLWTEKSPPKPTD